MATLTQEEIEQKKRLLKEKMDEMHAIYVELMEAGAYPLDDDELDGVAGGFFSREGTPLDVPYSASDGVFR